MPLSSAPQIVNQSIGALERRNAPSSSSLPRPTDSPTPYLGPCGLVVDVQAQQLCELEGASGLEASGTGPAFKVLQGLVVSWLLDAWKRNNQ
jgi:hypothetical protein